MNDSPEPFSIQPMFFSVREIHFVSHRPPGPGDHIDQSNIAITCLSTPFNEATKRIPVGLKAEFGLDPASKAKNLPFEVRIHLIAEFAVEDSFPRDQIMPWAEKGAPFIIYPFLRERLYSITAQCGYPPVMLPLLLLPTIKIEARPTLPLPDAAAKN